MAWSGRLWWFIKCGFVDTRPLEVLHKVRMYMGMRRNGGLDANKATHPAIYIVQYHICAHPFADPRQCKGRLKAQVAP